MSCEHCGAAMDVGALVCLTCGREQGGDKAPSPPITDEPRATDDPCPQHPDLPKAGTCPRCGAFVCIRCAPGSASGQLMCVDCLERSRPHDIVAGTSPFGGPLVLPLLGLVFRGVLGVGVALSDQLSSTGPWTALKALTFTWSAVMGLGSFWAIGGFVRRKRAVRVWLPALYAIDVVMLLVAGIYSPWLAWCGVWFPYFIASKRARATFTE